MRVSVRERERARERQRERERRARAADQQEVSKHVGPPVLGFRVWDKGLGSEASNLESRVQSPGSRGE